jgi:hypothetical protein
MEWESLGDVSKSLSLPKHLPEGWSGISSKGSFLSNITGPMTLGRM